VALRFAGPKSFLGQDDHLRYTPSMVFILKLLLAIGTGFAMWALL